MCLRTNQLLQNNNSIVTLLPTYATVSPVFTASINQAHSIAEQLNISPAVITEQKQAMFNDMVEKAYDLGLKTAAYAKLTGNAKLLSICLCRKSELHYASALNARSKAQAIYSAANPIATSLVSYGVTAAALTALKTSIDSFTVSIPTPQLSTHERAVLNERMLLSLKTAEQNLEKIDAMMEVIRLSQPDFYLLYKKVRKVVLASNILSIQGKVVDAKTGKEINGVHLEIMPMLTKTEKSLASKTEESMLKVSRIKGGFRIKNLAHGSYQVKASKPGYADQTITVYVSDGERSNIDLNLERLA